MVTLETNSCILIILNENKLFQCEENILTSYKSTNNLLCLYICLFFSVSVSFCLFLCQSLSLSLSLSPSPLSLSLSLPTSVGLSVCLSLLSVSLKIKSTLKQKQKKKLLSLTRINNFASIDLPLIDKLKSINYHQISYKVYLFSWLFGTQVRFLFFLGGGVVHLNW